MQLRWIPNATANGLHIADCAVRFPDQFAEASTLEAFRDDAVALASEVNRLDTYQASRFWPTLIANIAEQKSIQESVEQTLRRLTGSDCRDLLPVMVGKVIDLAAMFRRRYPRFDDQIAFRCRPLQEQWSGYGNGLFQQIKRMTTDDIVPEEARVIPLQPVLNGYGYAHMDSNLVWLEAVLTNPLSELPEVVRLAWVLSQINLELPRYSDAVGMGTLKRIAPLAMLPPVLAAAQVVELSRCTNEIAALAIEHWHIPIPTETSVLDELVPTLMDWWETYLVSRPPWHIGIQALAKMIRA